LGYAVGWVDLGWKQIFCLKVTLEYVNFYEKIPKTGEKKVWGH
jgi:hypothetical protein